VPWRLFGEPKESDEVPQVKRSPGRATNPEHSDFEAEVLPTRQWRL
jgi:hypothetical protein